MKNSFLNIGNKAFVNTDKVICIVAVDSDRVRKILAKRKLIRTSDEVFDGTSDKETRSIIYLGDNTYGISSVNASILAKRAQSDIQEFADEK